ERLLHETDHRALLSDCRELIARCRDLKLIGQDKKQVSLDPRDAAVPEAIRALNPSYVFVSDTVVTVELLGGFDHCGFHGFAVGVRGYGDDDLLEGLWYYTDK